MKSPSQLKKIPEIEENNLSNLVSNAKLIKNVLVKIDQQKKVTIFFSLKIWGLGSRSQTGVFGSLMPAENQEPEPLQRNPGARAVATKILHLHFFTSDKVNNHYKFVWEEIIWGTKAADKTTSRRHLK